MDCSTVPSEKLDATASVMGLLGDKRYEARATAVRCLPPFKDLSTGEIVDFLTRIGPSALDQQESPFSYERHYRRLQRHDAMAAGLDIAREWPDRFYGTLSKSNARWFELTMPELVIKLIAAIELWLQRLPDGHGLAIAEALQTYKETCLSGAVKEPFIDLTRHRYKKIIMPVRSIAS